MGPSTTRTLSNLTSSTIRPISDNKPFNYYDGLGSFYGMEITHIIVAVLLVIFICIFICLLVTCCQWKRWNKKRKNLNHNIQPNEMELKQLKVIDTDLKTDEREVSIKGQPEPVDDRKHHSSLPPPAFEMKIETEPNHVNAIDTIVNEKKTAIRHVHPIALHPNHNYKSYYNYNYPHRSRSIPTRIKNNNHHHRHNRFVISTITQNKTMSHTPISQLSAAIGSYNIDTLDTARSDPEDSYMSTEYQTETETFTDLESNNYDNYYIKSIVPEYVVVDTITAIVNKQSQNQTPTTHVLGLNKLNMRNQRSIEPSSVAFNMEPSESLFSPYY